MLPNIFSDVLNNYLECAALLAKEKDWIVPPPLHRGAIKQTIRKVVDSKTQDAKLNAEDSIILPFKTTIESYCICNF